MKSVSEIVNNNYDAVVDIIEEFLESRSDTTYQVDLYMYIDFDTEELTFDEFVNVGGNSWLNDNHYRLCYINELSNYYMDDNNSFRQSAAEILNTWIRAREIEEEYEI